MSKRWLIVVILSILALCNLGAAAQGTPGTIRGYVFRDDNRNGVFDANEEGVPNVFVTVSFGEYQHTYYTGNGDPNGNVPGPGSYGPTPLQAGTWTVTLHVPDDYVATTQTQLSVSVPEGGAATGSNFGLFGSGPISYSAGTGVAMGGGAGVGTLPQTGSVARAPQSHLIALLVALIGFLALLGTPWCVVQVKRVHNRWW